MNLDCRYFMYRNTSFLIPLGNNPINVIPKKTHPIFWFHWWSNQYSVYFLFGEDVDPLSILRPQGIGVPVNR